MLNPKCVRTPLAAGASIIGLLLIVRVKGDSFWSPEDKAVEPAVLPV
jgi:hypothetical protein